MNSGARLLHPSVPDLDQTILPSSCHNVWTIWTAANPADQPGVSRGVGMGQFQLGTPDTEPEVLANSGGGVGLVGALPDVQACQLVLVLSDWSLPQ